MQPRFFTFIFFLMLAEEGNRQPYDHHSRHCVRNGCGKQNAVDTGACFTTLQHSGQENRNSRHAQWAYSELLR